MKFLPYLMAAGIMALGTACSSTNTGNGTSATTDTTAGTTAGNTPSTTRMGSDMNPTTTPDANSGLTSTGAQTAPTANVMGTNGASASGSTASGGNVSADQTAFMNTFATMKDPAFLLTAASSNMLEIQAGQLASQRASNAEVKQFGQMMVSHHTKATQDLKAVATPLGVQMPQTLMPVHQAMADKLMNKSGKDFDEAYMDMMETAHKMDIALFEVKSKRAENATVQSFATQTLPMLRSHYSMADKLEDKAD